MSFMPRPSITQETALYHYLRARTALQQWEDDCDHPLGTQLLLSGLLDALCGLLVAQRPPSPPEGATVHG
jgi:hypothetical protein